MTRTTAPSPLGRGAVDAAAPARWAGPAGDGPDVDLDAAAGATVADAPRSAASSARATAAAVALALVASVTTGLVVHQRATTVARAVPRVEVGYPEVRALPAAAGTPRARIVLPVLNAGSEPVTVTSVALPERAGPVEMAGPRLVVAPGERARVSVDSRPRCGLATTGRADVATLVVRVGDGEPYTLSSELAAPFGRPALTAQLHGFCSAPGLGRPVQVAVSQLDDAALVLRVSNTSRHPAELALFAPRASGVVSDPALPLQLAEGQEVSITLTAAPECDTWSGGLPSMSVDVVASSPAPSQRPTWYEGRDAPSGWSALLTSWLGGQVARACDPGVETGVGTGAGAG